ncbi:MAG: hypothetical protein ACM3S0_03530 [Acidobacteriota bacterium]
MNFIYPLLVVLLAVFAIAPLEYPGAFQSHTGLLPVYNLINLDQNPLQFFNWAPTLGRTFDLFRSEGVLPYLAAEILHLIGFGYLDSIKIVYALAWIASGLTMYALARQWLSEHGALLASAVYIYLPYHLATIYVRGAFAESVAWAIFPVGLLSIAHSQSLPSTQAQVLTIDGWKTTFKRAIPFIVLFLTQPGMAILFAIVAVAVAGALYGWTRIGMRPILTSAIGGLAIGLILDLPAILRYGANILRDGFNSSFVLPFQLFSSLWGYGTSTGSFLDKFPFQLGVVPVGLVIIAAALAWQDRQSNRNTSRRLVSVFAGIAIIVSLMTFEIAAPLWKALGVFAVYPWQLLAFVGLALAVAAGTVVEFDERLARPAMTAVLVGLPVVASYGYLAPRFIDFTPLRPQIAVFGDNEIALLDYRIVGPLRHGATLRLQMQWQALREVDHDYTVFVHAVNEDGNTYGEQDSKPLDGALPTLQWSQGQVISDTHTIQIDVEGPREGYRLEVGLYQTGNGNRARMDNGSDVLILPRPGDPEPIISDQIPLAKLP